MNSVGRYLVQNGALKKILSSSDPIKKIAQKFVLGKNLEEILPAVEGWKKDGFGVILYPIEADSGDYLKALKFLSEKEITGSISLRTPLEDIDSVTEEAIHQKVRIEIDMRSPKTVDQTLQLYSEIKRKHTDSIICLQANLYRTAADIEDLTAVVPIVRLVKGAFNGAGTYQTKKDADVNFIKLAKRLMDKGIKTYIATHDQKLINEFIKYTEKRGIERELFGFQMLYGVRTKLQEELLENGHEVWKYVAYGEDWVPYCVNRIFERKENITFALNAILRG
ncbi:MAG: proline dehydrogenase family protein [Nanoarchaeota archaeon]